jgi:hypothetical protein
MRPTYLYTYCGHCNPLRVNVHVQPDGTIARHFADVRDSLPCPGSGTRAPVVLGLRQSQEYESIRRAKVAAADRAPMSTI